MPSHKHSSKGKGNEGGGSRRRDERRQSHTQDAHRPPSPEDILREAQTMLRNLQTQSQLYQDQYNHHARESRRLQILMNSLQEERQLLSGSAAAVQASRQGRMVSPAEIETRRRELERDIENLNTSVAYYQNASESMSRMYASVEAEIQRLAQDIEDLSNRRRLASYHEMQ
ncbi:hypothetical protein ACJZ2D_017103 [Fusarium nematophilum]